MFRRPFLFIGQSIELSGQYIDTQSTSIRPLGHVDDVTAADILDESEITM